MHSKQHKLGKQVRMDVLTSRILSHLCGAGKEKKQSLENQLWLQTKASDDFSIETKP